MKKLEFETSKGAFFMVDAIERKNLHDGIFLKQITEEQASEIVDSEMSGTVLGKLVTDLDNHRIEIYNYEWNNKKFLSAVNCLHSLIKSKGVNLFENPVKHPECECTIDECCNFNTKYEEFQEQEENTFYNPVIFKL